MTDEPSETTQNAPQSQPHSGLRAFLTGAIVAGSVLMGGLAVVLWNRKSLSHLRQPVSPNQNASAPTDDE